MIVLSGNVTIGREVDCQLYQAGKLSDKGMHHNVGGTSEYEGNKIHGGYGWVDTVKELGELGQKNDMCKTLGQLLEKLGWRASDDRSQKPEREFETVEWTRPVKQAGMSRKAPVPRLNVLSLWMWRFSKLFLVFVARCSSSILEQTLWL